MMESARTTASRKGMLRAQSCNVRATVVTMMDVPGNLVTSSGPVARVILEFDGEQKYVDHPGRDRYEAARDRALTRAGWTVVHLTWADIFQKEREVITHLRKLLLR